MDYHSLRGQDISSFSSSSPHRMPTVSAAQALQDLQSLASRSISTGLPTLDAILQRRDVLATDVASPDGGLPRGQVTEVYGPPGVGKTALGIQLAASALRVGQSVVWVDAAHPLPGQRLREVVSFAVRDHEQGGPQSPQESSTVDECLKNLTHFTTATLPHLIALLCHPSPSFPPQKTSLIVIDSMSTLIANTYPKTIEKPTTPRKVGVGRSVLLNKADSGRSLLHLAFKYDQHNWASSRKWDVMHSIISSLQKLATLHNVAVVILSQSVTKMQSGSAATLAPAISSTAWDAGISTRIVIFRDWGWGRRQVRFAGVLKSYGAVAASNGATGKVAGFEIKHGLAEILLPDVAVSFDTSLMAMPSRKRKADEIGDSEDDVDLEGSDEDYGWAEEDDGALPQPPPQWQGSEDILVSVQDEADDSEESEENEKEAEEPGNE